LEEGEYHSLDNRAVLKFIFYFSSDMTIEMPKILLNTTDEDERVRIMLYTG